MPGLRDLHDTATVAARIGLPLNVLWQPDVDPAALAGARVARISTGSALYRHALGAAVTCADAARGGPAPATTPVTYQRVQELLG